MQQVTPTKKWQQNILPIPIGSSPPVRRPLNNPQVITLEDRAASYLVDQGYALYCNAFGQPLAVPSKETKRTSGSKKRKSKETDVSARTSQATGEKLSPQVQSLAVKTIQELSPAELAAAVKWIGEEKATELAQVSDLTWEKASEMLSERQIEHLIEFVEKAYQEQNL